MLWERVRLRTLEINRQVSETRERALLVPEFASNKLKQHGALAQCKVYHARALNKCLIS